MPMDIRDVERVIVNKFGFEKASERSSDHKWYKLRLEGLPLISTKFSHSRGSLSKTIEGMIARQLRVSKDYFHGMIRCANGRDDYYRQVREAPRDVRF
jgi:hypothetical protein